jgi:hypothetical protein
LEVHINEDLPVFRVEKIRRGDVVSRERKLMRRAPLVVLIQELQVTYAIPESRPCKAFSEVTIERLNECSTVEAR